MVWASRRGYNIDKCAHEKRAQESWYKKDAHVIWKTPYVTNSTASALDIDQEYDCWSVIKHLFVFDSIMDSALIN